MKCIIGLGNPGAQYSKTYHNLGLIFVTWLHELLHSRSANELIVKKSEYETIKLQQCLLIKPNTYMNTSFKALGPTYNLYKLQAENILVMHDELMLQKYDIKLRVPDGITAPGNAGHNGLRNISEHISPHFARLRIGIDHPKNFNSRISVHDYVLSQIDSIDGYKKEFEKTAWPLIKDWLTM